MSFAVGENIGPYRVIEQLGQGGMATVYKAYHAALDRYVALKVLHPAFGEDPNFEARFRREARLVAKLDHPNIVPIYDYSEHDKRPFLVMKFIEGETLKARMARGPLASDELTKIIEAVGAGLSYAHKMGILHRDIKPSNVLITNDGAIYLADFGLARIASMGESTLSGDMIMGTPQYISPEQAMGKKDLDEGTDIYSFGVMLYEMVVGQVPFNADTPFSIIHDHIYTPLPIPRTINATVPETVERVLLKTLSKERVDRYPTVADMVTAFKQAWMTAGVPMAGTTVTLPPQPVSVSTSQTPPSLKADSTPTPVRSEVEGTNSDVSPKPKKRPRWTLIAGAVIIFLCCLFGLVALRRGGLFPSPGEIATRTAAALTTPEVTEPASVTDIPPDAHASNVVDDFESAPPAGTSGWEGYFDETTDSKLICATTSDSAYSGARSLQFEFDIAANSWATCGFYFSVVENWSAWHGLSFYMRADRPAMPYEVALYGGTAEVRTTYRIQMVAPPGSETDWMLVEIRWPDVLRAKWEANPGAPFDPKEVTGFSIGFSESPPERARGVIWLDDLKLLDSLVPRPPDNATPSSAILEAQRAVDQNPNDPYAYLRLSLALWDAGQPRRAFEILGKGADLAGQDQAFFNKAADEFKQREAWVAAAGMYERAILSQQGGEIPDELLTNFHEAVYRAAASADLPFYLSFDSIAKIDQALAFVAQGRYNLHRGDNAKAFEFVERARGVNPDMPEVTLLNAEIFIKEGNTPEARQLFTQLMENPNTPEWIRSLVNGYLIQNP